MRKTFTAEEADGILQSFPDITDDQDSWLHKHFTKYIFYQTLKNGARECRCTYCGEHYIVEPISRVMDYNHQELMRGRHNETAKCPKCERTATLKNLGISGKRKNLYEQMYCVAFRLMPEGLYARAFVASKGYQETPVPKIKLNERARYFFSADGRAGMWKYEYDWTGYGIRWEGWKIRKTIFEAFQRSYFSGYDGNYYVLGVDDLKKSQFKYCAYEQYDGKKLIEGDKRDDLMLYLGAYSARPQIEMLVKMGFGPFVDDLVNRRITHGKMLNWKAKKPTDLFNLSGQEFKDFAKLEPDFQLLETYKQLNAAGHKVSLGQARNMIDTYGHELEKFIDLVNDTQIPIHQARKYLQIQNERADKAKLYMGYALTYWRDYLQAAKQLQYDLSREDVIMPKILAKAHDAATAAVKHQSDEEKNRAYQIRTRELEKKYAYEDDRYAILIPQTMEEIIAEGKALSHCVGGYAARHVEGKTTILFLRDKNAIKKPLYTIEMNGSKLVQVQGKQNRTPLTPEAKEFFNAWQAWVKDGSKRRKKAQTVSQKKSA